MNKITLFTVIFTLFLSCGNAQKTEQKTDSLIKKEDKKMSTIHLTTAEFKEKVFNYEVGTEWKYAGDKPCLIDFWAAWCGPCRMVAPVLEELAQEYAGQLYIYKVDTESEQELAAAFGIRSIPSLLFVPMDGQPQMAVGALGKADLKRAIEEVLLK